MINNTVEVGPMPWQDAVDIMTTALALKFRPYSPEGIRFATLGMVGEAGELANLINKDWRGDNDNASARQLAEWRHKVAMEVADVLIYLNIVCRGLDLDEEECIREKLEELCERWPHAGAAIADAMAARGV